MQRSLSCLLSGAMTRSNSSLRSVLVFIMSSSGSTSITASIVLRLSSMNTRVIDVGSRPFSAHVLHTNRMRANSGHVRRLTRLPVKGRQPGTAMSCSESTDLSCVKRWRRRIDIMSSSVEVALEVEVMSGVEEC